ncbi:choice-of-anchor G family protein [Psychromicrobium lacuslunae]|uniref:Gram-positive cocci surface proteins LPxTG domain-containing protein n=1 Tax=Psychromicrobium lacuslunae TaxID=1618207 RepID=A0A0D4BYQ3_9MICC|nr:choice-of-anchor G family protein [Psychromicrobium lacuslunae]AJT41231.1 hypothetical protein UM93_06325 [Psychromicrobium lacuslunae]
MRNPGGLRVSRKAWAGRLVAGIAAAALIALPITPAQAAGPTVSQALGKFFGGQVLGVNLDTIAALNGSLADNPNGAHPLGPNNQLSVSALGLNLSLGGALNLLGGANPLLAVGPAAQYSKAANNGDAVAASGAVSDQGAISVGAPGTPPADAHLDLGPVLDTVPALKSILSTARVDVGALASQAQQLAGGAPSSQYLVSDLKVQLTSPAIGGVYTTLRDQVVTPTSQALQTLANSLSAINIDLNVVALRAQGSVSAVLPDLSAVLPSGFLNGNVDNGVSINLATGAVILDLTKILTANGLNINNLPPNSQLFTGPIAAAIATGITSTLTDIIQGTVQRLTNAVNSTRVTGSLAISSLGAPLGNVTIDASLAQIQDNTSVIVSGSVAGLNLGLLNTLLKPLLRPAVTTLLNTVNNIQTTVVQPLINGAAALVAPILTALNQLVPVRVNVQPAVGDLGAGSFTVRALEIGILNLAAIDFASSTVHGTLAPVLTPTLSANPSTVEQGASSQISGTGFAPGDAVTITLPAAPGIPAVVVNATTDASGNLGPVPLPIPANYPLGAVTVSAHPTDSNVTADPTVQLTVIKHVYTTSLTADPTSLPQGGTTTVTGTGYEPGETVTISGPCVTPPVTITADPSGGFSTPVTLSASCPVGPTTITAEGNVSQTPATATVTISGPAYNTAITATPSSVPQGSSPVIAGTGFAPGESVTVTLPAKDGVGPVVVSGVTVAPDGTFSTPLTVPATYPLGAVNIDAVGAVSNTPASTAVTIVPAGAPALSANPASVAQGATTQISGTNFAAGENVVVTLPAASPAGAVTVNATADSAGNFTVPLTVPSNHPIGASFPVNATGDQSSTASTAIAVAKGSWTTTLTVTPATIAQTGTTTISGSGFAPGESVTVTLPAKDGVGPVTATNVLVAPDGTFSTPLTIPSNYPLGAVDVSALGPISDTAAATTLNVVAAGPASITAVPATVPQGGTTQLSGTNFKAGENVTITLPAASPAAAVTVNATADSAGNFTVPLTVPMNHPVGASFPLNAAGDQSSTANTTIGVSQGSWNTAITATPNPVAQSGELTVSGTGFAAGETVNVTLPAKDGVGPVTVPNVLVAPDGSFSTSLIVPANYPLGSVDVSALGPISNTAASATVDVVAAGPAAIAANPVQVPQGTATTITGTGYGAGEAVIVSLPAAAPAAAVSVPVTADSAGQFSVTLTVPMNHPVASGVLVSGNGPDHQATTPIDVTLGTWTPSISLAPSTVPQGSATSVTGSGFAAGESVTVTLPEKDGVGPISVTTTVNPDGTLVPVDLTVPASYPLGGTTLSAVGTVSGTPATAAATVVAAGPPSITPIPASVPQGGSTQIAGANFKAGEVVTLTFPAAAPAAAVTVTATANSAGQFTAVLNVPQNHPVGPTFPVTAVGDQASTAASSIAVTQGSWNTALAATPSNVPQGIPTTIDGTGFAAGESVTVTLPAAGGVGPVVVPNVLVAPDGSFSTPLTIPANYPLGAVTVSAVGPISNTPATVQLTVLPAGSPSISAAPPSVPQGGTTQISGTNFAAGENVTLTLPAADPASAVTVTATADSAGNFTVPLTVPMNHPVGASFPVNAVGDQGANTATTIGVTKGDWNPAVSANPSDVPQGSSTTISGTGFAAGEKVTITLPAKDGVGPVTVSDVVVAPDGTFSASLPVPANYPQGTSTVSVLGTISDTPATVDLNVVPGGAATLSANPGSVPQGGSTVVTGTNYGPGEQVVVSIPAAAPAAASSVTVTADSAGQFTVTLPVPKNHPVANDVLLSGNGPDHQATTTVDITKGSWETSITATPSEVPQGSNTTVTGSGFAAGEKVTVTLPAAGNAPAVTVSDVLVAPDGTFTATLPVPANYPQGAATVSVAGPISDTPATAPITVLPGGPATLTASPSQVPQGTQLTLTGANYAANELATITLPAAAPAAAVSVKVTTDSAGQFSTTMTVPQNHPIATGVVLTGVGADSERSASATIEVTKGTWTPTVTADPSTLVPGSTTTVSGHGFAAGEKITITLPAKGGVGPVVIKDVLVGPDGSFEQALSIPANYPLGQVQLSVLGSISNTKTATTLRLVAKPPVVKPSGQLPNNLPNNNGGQPGGGQLPNTGVAGLAMLLTISAGALLLGSATLLFSRRKNS